MPSDWSRRAFLASVGAAAFAGCATVEDGSPDRSPTGTPPSTPSWGGNSTEDERTPTPGDDDPAEPRGEPSPPERISGEWPMPGHDPGQSNYASGSAGPTEPIAELWSRPIDATPTAPVVVDDTLYVGGSDGAVRAFDARTGERNWRTPVGTPAGTPWAVADRLYVPARGAVVALDPADGAEKWRVDTPTRRAFLAAEHGLYYVPRKEPTVVALDPSGEERWRADVDDPWTSNLFASDERVFVPTDTANPKPWIFDAETGDFAGENRPEGEGYHFPGERFYLDGTVYAADPFYGSLWAFDARDGYGLRWRAGLGDPGGDYLAAGADHLYANARADGPFFALSTNDGEEVWSRTDVESLSTRPVVAGDALLVRTDGEVRCFDTSDGAERWSRPAGDVGGRIVVVDDLVYATGGDEVRAFRPP